MSTKGTPLRELMLDADFRQLMVGDEAETDESDDQGTEPQLGVYNRRDTFYDALKANPPPCTGCPFAVRCGPERLVCLEFAQWADPAFLRKQPGRIAKAEVSTPDAPYTWVYDELYPPMTPEAWAEETRRLDAAVANGSMKAGKPSHL